MLEGIRFFYFLLRNICSKWGLWLYLGCLLFSFLIPMKKWIKKRMRWVLVILLLAPIFFKMGIILYNRIDASSENWKYFSCKLTGKEQTMINCSDKNKDFMISGDQVSFAGRGSWNSVYIPFSSDRITLRIDPETRAGYDFWVLYDTFGWKELQKVDKELIADTTAEESEKVARWKRNDNFFFEKDAQGYGIITIDTRKPFWLSLQGLGAIDPYKWNQLLSQPKHPKGVIVMVQTTGKT